MDKLVIEAYRRLGSVKAVAQYLGVSVVKVRRILITAGLWRSERSDAILDLLHEGFSSDEIATKLNVTRKAVEAYMPYTQGSYGGFERSYAAFESDLYRQRKRYAFSKQVNRSVIQNPMPKGKERRTYMKIASERKVLHLHLELDTSALNIAELALLHEYGKVGAGLTRDVIVPTSITLHALHYMIQQLFGWQNAHLHHFALPKEAFTMLTGDRFESWKKLCGIYFQVPDTEDPDRFWDDDYDEKRSFNSWLRKKYCGPYQYDTDYDQYSACQEKLQALLDIASDNLQHFQWAKETSAKSVPAFDQATIEDAYRYFGFDGNLESLLERLTLAQIMIPNKKRTPFVIGQELTEPLPITKTLHYYYDYGDGWEVKISLVENSLVALDHLDAAENEKPVCVAKDGLNVMDDVGGIAGYCKFLNDIHFGDPCEAVELRYMATLKGWSTRQRAPENTL